MSAHVDVRTTASSEVVARADSGSDGTFVIDLRPGTYVVTASIDSGVPTPQTKQLIARVWPNRLTPLVFLFDSGIRGPIAP